MIRLPLVYLNKNILWEKNVSLRAKCNQINVEKPEILNNTQVIIKEMFKVLYSEPSGVALAAPQIGINAQIVTIDYQDFDTNNHELYALINPTIIDSSSDTFDSKEICLSIPNYRGTVLRANSITVRACDYHGNPFELSASGFLSAVLQHEIDHLNGILFIDKTNGDLEPIPDFAERKLFSTINILEKNNIQPES